MDGVVVEAADRRAHGNGSRREDQLVVVEVPGSLRRIGHNRPGIGIDGDCAVLQVDRESRGIQLGFAHVSELARA